jgi:hypothetical protein
MFVLPILVVKCKRFPPEPVEGEFDSLAPEHQGLDMTHSLKSLNTIAHLASWETKSNLF